MKLLGLNANNQKTIGSLLVGFSIILIFILIFVKLNIDKEGAYLCEIVSANPQFDMEECPAHNTNTSWLLTASFGIAFLVLGSGVYLIFMPTKIIEKVIEQQPIIAHKQEFREIDLSKLDENEKKIYDMLKSHEGSMYQSDIIKETGLSKVQITRLLDKMIVKQIIDKKRRGMTNIVVLK